ncbi:MAG: DUF4867 family protein [Lachnospiraceae bacterium]|nr:DUF4867 family protein [Lachnospiraceae bacterium]
MEVKKVTDAAFKKYGRIITDYDCSELIKKMEETPMPADEVIYIPSDANLEALAIGKVFTESVFGGLPMQIGYCNGTNKLLNGCEYHRSSEFNVACTDLIMLLGSQQDIEDDYTYDTSKIEAFFLPAGTMIECYATTLHYAPCSVDGKGFRCVVALPRDTNLDLDVVPSDSGEDKLLVAKNKWLIAHPDANIEGAFNGLKGVNVSVD